MSQQAVQLTCMSTVGLERPELLPGGGVMRHRPRPATPEAYSTPSMTIGVAPRPRLVPRSAAQARPSWPTDSRVDILERRTMRLAEIAAGRGTSCRPRGSRELLAAPQHRATASASRQARQYLSFSPRPRHSHFKPIYRRSAKAGIQRPAIAAWIRAFAGTDGGNSPVFTARPTDWAYDRAR